MAVAPKLQLKQSQSLVMTPQLQQAIKLLQLSNIELAAFVEEQLESNPLLERGTGDENRRGEDVETVEAPETFTEVSLDAPTAKANESFDAPDHAIDSEAGPAEQAADVGGSVDWSKSGAGGSFNGSSDYDAAANTAAEKTLSEHLNEQLAMAVRDPKDRFIGAYLIDHVDENGYLRTNTSEIATRLGVPEIRIQSLLTELQTFEPTGVFARDLKECLALQLKEKELLSEPMEALLDNLPMLGKHDLTGLTKICNVSMDTLHNLIRDIKTLAPKPGLAYGGDVAAAVEPDVAIRELPNGGWAVELNADTLPRVLIDNRYFAEICGQNSDETTRTFMSECHQNASWLVKALDQRARTVLKVATEIVKQQDGFFAFGVDHLKPLNLRTVAEAIDMHESTISRVTSNKFMSTPRGLFEFKFFFTAAIPSMDGGEAHSAESVRHRIKQIISQETAKSVLSDDKIVDMLRTDGIDVARRTVAKYREALGIPSSVERRRIFKNNAI